MPRYITMSISRKFIIRLVRECSLNKLEQRRDSPYSMSKLIIKNSLFAKTDVQYYFQQTNQNSPHHWCVISS